MAGTRKPCRLVRKIEVPIIIVIYVSTVLIAHNSFFRIARVSSESNRKGQGVAVLSILAEGSYAKMNEGVR